MATEFDYMRLAATAQRLIKRFGRPISVRYQVETPNANPSKPPTVAQVTEPTIGVLTKFTTQEVKDLQLPVSDVSVIIAGLDLPAEVKINGFVIADGTTWKIINFWQLAPGQVRLLWKLQVRR